MQQEGESVMVDRMRFACLCAFIFLLICGPSLPSGCAHHDFTPSFLRIPEAGAASCTVTTTDDTGPGTLRHCITIANGTRGTTIDFGITTAPNAQDEQGNAWWRIEVLSPLPTITADNTVLDGTTQPGDMNAKGPEIEIYGGSAAGADGLTVSDAHSVTIRGLVLSGFRSAAAAGGTGILITGADATDNRVEGNYVGTDATGTSASGNDNGIAVRGAGAGNRIGGTAVGAGNVISGNRHEGLWVSDTTGTIVRGNFIGTNQANASIPNGRDGIRLQNAPGSVIGGGHAGARNVVPGTKYMAGCRKSPAMVLDTTVNDVPVEVRGSVEAFALLVNARVADLPAADIRVQGNAIDEIIDMRGGELDRPLEFQMEINAPETVSSWTLNVSDLQGNALWSTKGEGPPTPALLWDGLVNGNAILKSGDVYQYQLAVNYKDGSRAASPVRLFGLARSSAVSIALGSGAYLPHSEELSEKSKMILRDAAAVLRTHPREKIIIEGHADSTGTEKLKRDLARKRTAATASYLINKENIPAERISVRLSDRLVRTAGAGEGADGRVEVKGEFSDEERPQILDRHRTQPVIRINRASVPVNDGGRFSHMIEERCDHIEIELRDAQGRAVQTLLPLPKINLHVPCQGMYVPFHLSKTGEDSPADRQGKGQEAEARLEVKGETEKGNTLKMNGQDVNITEDGAFVLGLRLREGENVYELELSNPQGYTRLVMLVARATLEKPRRGSDRGGRETQFTEKSEGTQR